MVDEFLNLVIVHTRGIANDFETFREVFFLDENTPFILKKEPGDSSISTTGSTTYECFVKDHPHESKEIRTIVDSQIRLDNILLCQQLPWLFWVFRRPDGIAVLINLNFDRLVNFLLLLHTWHLSLEPRDIRFEPVTTVLSPRLKIEGIGEIGIKSSE